jgi:small subunit ribosomal protein S6
MNFRSISMSVNSYEVTILVRAAAARADYEGTLAAVRAVYEAEGAKFTELDKWDERKLAYQIEGETSALYLNGYFNADPLAIDKIERRAQLGEVILRQLIIARPGKDMERIREQRVKQAAAAAAAALSAASEA